MSTPTHTPGPWHYEQSSQEFGTGPTVESEFGIIVHMPQPEDDEGQANARLIAASPDMMAALEALIKWEQYMGGFEGPAWQAAIDALAKAKEGGK